MEKDYTLTLRPKAPKDSIVAGSSYRFTVLTDCLIRMEYQAEGRFTDSATQTVLCRDLPTPKFRVEDREDRLEIVTDSLHLYYDKQPFSPHGLRVELKKAYFVYGSVWRYGDSAHGLKGTARTLDGADGPVELGGGLVSRAGFALLDDSGTACLTEDMWICPRPARETDLYFFGYGHDYLRCLRDFARISGQTPLLPRFALGNWWSRYYRYTEESYLELMERFREKGVPLSVAVVDMDWHVTDPPEKYGSGWTGYTWNRELFPEPQRFLEQLHRMGLRVTLNVHPAQGVRAYEEAYPAVAAALGSDGRQGEDITFSATDRRFMEAYFKYLHHPNEEMGVDFWWIDWQQGTYSDTEGIDPLWMLNHLHFLDNGRAGRRPLILSRYAGPGSHRYPVGFSGDTFSTWASLDFQPYFTASASNIGYSWWSHDIGGHLSGVKDDELAVRWVQLGVFSPVNRLHSSNNPFSGKEPWNYSPEAERIMTDFLRLRHRLIPYLYTMNVRTHREALPLVQPMYYKDDVLEAYSVPNEYWFGSEMVVCPMTRPVDGSILAAGFDAWLPEGEFIDLFTRRLYKGGRRMKLYRGLEHLPVLVKAGGIVPLSGDGPLYRAENPRELEVLVFAGADGSFDLIEDDGRGPEGKSAATHFCLQWGNDARLDLIPEPGVIPDRIYDIRMCGCAEPESAFLEGGEELERSYDADLREFRLRFRGVGPASLRLRLKDSRPVGPDTDRDIYRFLQRAQISSTLKEDIWRAIGQERDSVRLFVELNRMDLTDCLRSALMEFLAADR